MTVTARGVVPRFVPLVVALGLLTGIAAAQGQKEDPVFNLGPVEVKSPWVLVPPSLKDVPKPPYPEGARARGEQGSVSLLVRVRADGSVGEVKVRQSSGHAALDEAAVTGARAWTFVPARRGPNPIEAWVEVPVEFKLQ
jgi:TonB family protein